MYSIVSSFLLQTYQVSQFNELVQVWSTPFYLKFQKWSFQFQKDFDSHSNKIIYTEITQNYLYCDLNATVFNACTLNLYLA